MAAPYFRGDTIDDLMRYAIEEILSTGEWITASKGTCQELTGVLLELTNPRARLSRTETRGKPFSCLGELCWYLAKTKSLEFISYYLPSYSEFADDNEIFGGYGPRLFNWKGLNQWANVTELLRKKPSSRQAVIQLFDANDISEEHKDVPCTCTLQFMVRGERLHLITNMRSNDVFRGFTHDFFTFTMLQEIMARSLSIELGIYKHHVGSLHLYEQNVDAARRFLSEGWQPTDMPMPPMPIGDPWPSIHLLLEAEAILRAGKQLENGKLEELGPYWADLTRLLQVFRLTKDQDLGGVDKLLGDMASNVYHTFIHKRITEDRRN
jgi:thymidylate synthase